VRLLGIPIHRTSAADCVAHVLDELDAGRGGMLVTPNLDHLRRLVGEAEFRALYAGAQRVVADGMVLVWAARLQGTPLPERVAGSDLIWSLTRGAAGRGRSVFLLGGDEGMAERAAAVLAERCPGLSIAGHHCPPRGFEEDPRAAADLALALREARPDVIYVGLGSPKQERLIERLRGEHPGAWWLGVGISFSFVTGSVRRAPRWMQRWGLEWTHRLAQEPRRLARRYLVLGLPFALRMFASALAVRLRS
jgi:N-acetylglucosaminyldiphosphoundecaprenol N-acetyl-beta-D-mannosaminyltransferase